MILGEKRFADHELSNISDHKMATIDSSSKNNQITESMSHRTASLIVPFVV